MYYVDIGNFTVKVKGDKYEEKYGEGNTVKLLFNNDAMNFYKSWERITPISISQ